jgi:hypothetical protein
MRAGGSFAKFTAILRASSLLDGLAVMSAIHPKADIAERDETVRFVPKADSFIEIQSAFCRDGFLRASLSTSAGVRYSRRRSSALAGSDRQSRS